MALQISQNSDGKRQTSHPPVLHVGSGKDFRADWLNLDVDPFWRPDVVCDLNQALPRDGTLIVRTERFGTLHLGAEVFDEIVAQEVLEHIRELPIAMTTLLHWLKTGGVLKFTVPYELSLGAWSDPTHVRAFNERSFIYYTDWSWYLGWQTHHFRMQRLDFLASDFGKELVANGVPQAEILRTPRAVDTMYVEMVKQPLDPQALAALQHFTQRPLPR